MVVGLERRGLDRKTGLMVPNGDARRAQFIAQFWLAFKVNKKIKGAKSHQEWKLKGAELQTNTALRETRGRARIVAAAGAGVCGRAPRARHMARSLPFPAPTPNEHPMLKIDWVLYLWPSATGPCGTGPGFVRGWHPLLCSQRWILLSDGMWMEGGKLCDRSRLWKLSAWENHRDVMHICRQRAKTRGHQRPPVPSWFNKNPTPAPTLSLNPPQACDSIIILY